MSPLRRVPQHHRPVPPQPVPDGGLTTDTALVALDDADPSRRRAAVVELADVAAGSATGEVDLLPHPLLLALVERVGREVDPVVRQALLVQLSRFDRREVVAGLVPHLASDDAALRGLVAQALTRMPVHAGAVLPELVGSDDPGVRTHAVMILAGLQLPHVEAILLHLVDTDPEATITAAAAEELLRLAGDRHLPALARARERFPDDPFIGFLAVRATGGPTTGPAEEAFA